DPDKLAGLSLTAADVISAIAQQNIQVAAGQIGQEPAPPGQQFQLTINTRGRLTRPEEFAAIILKGMPSKQTGQSSASGSSSEQGGQDNRGGQSAPSSSSSDLSSTLVPSNGIVRLRDVA